MSIVTVIGGGLAGSEAAWQLAQRGISVKLYEMRPQKSTGAHVSDRLAELVCSNSLGSKLPDRATGLLQHEMKLLKSLLIDCAERSSVAAGGALAVDRELFSTLVTDALTQHPNIEIIREEVTKIPEDVPVIVATGPLTSPTLAKEIGILTGEEYLYFYDAISPIVTAESIDMSIAFLGNRYDRGEDDEGDYINCPMDKEQYLRFVEALKTAERIELRDFEREDPHFFEGCVPIEQLASRGDETLAYGPMRPVGIWNPHTNQRPYAVVQLRKDNLAGSLYNIVGFQTNIRWGQQAEILRMISGLENASFVRMGQMHRNTFMNAPTLLYPTMQFRKRDDLYFAGQITGIEGYAGNIGTGLLAGLNLAHHLMNKQSWVPSETTMLGALCHYVTETDPEDFQPMKANFGILPELEKKVRGKGERKKAYAARALEDMKADILESDDTYLTSEMTNSVSRQL
ncbi:methylenetetrahydrofolate--tRNA-(uracil(54)-C(5))-methyltransferase (FADH(2)-oxidizing) TrmFO [Phototrophicus methaneseepsis]|uniref:Methylenetetrahydrofolate--tRNA-(uracil-5-)-methyltransferase TrmFO n=1 Tax=Phototrophicus methaneseepsis TaxID=2710758 RepID=A0A7S8E6B8_9CHLR|nr:methylenetetrahydrofolate--tRNA-(uracil(54)-C(5))-methyltransferase (FADH(2)-oxidizing) TrmFO [Phototrophicus methaneseepsis]QPC81204.1 methylenetetrahydrofolate--tRNA-(uracil(54)-C(5))-methyltransferase (FADH(2)-oxidizing) TrmFO [Phototrophicus methaneseepsis]